LYHDVGRLVMLAFPGQQTTHRDVLAVEAFVGALNDEALEVRVRDREPRDLDHALQIALSAEANSRAHLNVVDNLHRLTEDQGRRGRRGNAPHEDENYVCGVVVSTDPSFGSTQMDQLSALF